MAVVNPEGALWYRGFATLTRRPDRRTIRGASHEVRCERFVTGPHAATDRTITVRFGGRVMLIDTGMLTGYYKGRASALESTATS